jgi:hypothetical protein
MSLRALRLGPLPVTAPPVLKSLMARMVEHRTIGMREAAGFEAIEIEDKLVPKRAIDLEKLLAVERATVEKGKT